MLIGKHEGLERSVRHFLKAQVIAAQEAYQRHLESVEKGGNSWLVEDPFNLIKARRKAMKEARKAAPFKLMSSGLMRMKTRTRRLKWQQLDQAPPNGPRQQEKPGTSQIVVVDVDEAQPSRQVKLLRKGRGKLMAHVERIVADLAEAGTVKSGASRS